LGIIRSYNEAPNRISRALSLERLAANEEDSTFKIQLLDQAAAYRKLAAKRASDFGLPPPSPP
jgi:hypothetical protein